MDLKTLRAGDKVIFHDSKVISKYTVLKDGDILTMVNEFKPEHLKLDQDHLKAQPVKFKREADGLHQEIFLRDIRPLIELGGQGYYERG